MKVKQTIGAILLAIAIVALFTGWSIWKGLQAAHTSLDLQRAAKTMSEIKIVQDVLRQYADAHLGQYPATGKQGSTSFVGDGFPALGEGGWSKEGTGWYLTPRQTAQITTPMTYYVSIDRDAYALEFTLPAASYSSTQPPQRVEAGTNCATRGGIFLAPVDTCAIAVVPE